MRGWICTFQRSDYLQAGSCGPHAKELNLRCKYGTLVILELQVIGLEVTCAVYVGCTGRLGDCVSITVW